MRGIILSYQGGQGLISGQDGNRYEFFQTEWNGQKSPIDGIEIDFLPAENVAKSIFPLRSDALRSQAVLAIVCWFLGALGIHRFMVGKIGTGIVMLVLFCTIVGAIVSGFWAIIDLIMIVMGNFTDKDGNKIRRAI